MSKHTPGPWKAVKNGISRWAVRTITTKTAHSKPVASMWLNGDCPKADARLIAAAPDLLALLKEAADWIESAADEVDDPAGATTFAHNIRAVTAKADGES